MVTVFVSLVVSVFVYLGMEFFIMPMLTQKPPPAVKMEAPKHLSPTRIFATSVQVPSVRGVSRSRAETLLKQAGLKVGKITYGSDDDISPGWVLQQNPRPGTALPSGSPVDLTLNKE